MRLLQADRSPCPPESGPRAWAVDRSLGAWRDTRMASLTLSRFEPWLDLADVLAECRAEGPDGEVSFGWFTAPDWGVAVALNANGRLSYAAIFGANRCWRLAEHLYLGRVPHREFDDLTPDAAVDPPSARLGFSSSAPLPVEGSVEPEMMCDLAQRNGVSLASAPSKQGVQFSQHLTQHLTQHRSRRSTREDRPPVPPVQALDLIRKDHARYAPCGRERHFERVASYSGRNRTDERQASPPARPIVRQQALGCGRPGCFPILQRENSHPWRRSFLS